MFRTIGFKVSAAIFVVLVLSFIAMQLILNLDFKNTADKMSKSNLNTVSSSVFQTMRMAMNLGDPEKIQEAIEDAKTIEGISDIKIYPSKETIELFEIKNPKISQEKLIIDQFTQPNLISLEQKLDNINHLRLIRPLIADESCIACHANANLGSVLGVMDVYHSLENIEKDIAKTSRSYIVIFTIALIFTLVVVLFVLKMVVGNPIMELLSHAKELAQGSGNLRARIRVKGRDEIAKACEYINQFIEKTQKTVSSASLNSKNVEKQSILLNSNAIELNEISTSSHQKIDGKGFSVIAEDIRALANNSEEFLHNVELIIKELLESIQEVAKELKENSHSIFSLNENTHLLASSANEVKLCNQDSKNLVTQCTQRIKISQENIQNLLMHMRENVEASGKNEEISKILLQVADELKIVCHNLESELSQFQI